MCGCVCVLVCNIENICHLFVFFSQISILTLQ